MDSRNANLYHERLMDMSARKYSKTQGAFTGVDALWSQSVGYSPYAYSFHDPINFMDPTGLAGQAGPSSPTAPPRVGVAGHPVINEDDKEKVKVIEIVVIVDATDPYYPIMKADVIAEAAAWNAGAGNFLRQSDARPYGSEGTDVGIYQNGKPSQIQNYKDAFEFGGAGGGSRSSSMGPGGGGTSVTQFM